MADSLLRDQQDSNAELILRQAANGTWELIEAGQVVRVVDESGQNRLSTCFPQMPPVETALIQGLVTGDMPSAWPKAVSPGEDPRKLKKPEILPWLRNNLSIRFNELTRKAEIFGEEVTGEFLEAIDLILIERCGIDANKGALTSGVLLVAKENPYNPFVAWLESLPQGAELEEGEWNSLDEKMLGYADPWALTKLQKQLVGTVKRALEPGYQHDTCLVLYGEQGRGKDRMMRKLFGEDWYFGGGSYDPKNKDTVLSMYSAIAVGFAEVERIFSRAGSSQVKDFLTQVDDRIRAPYGRSYDHTKRHFTFWASTNDPHLLRDATGNRRFPWVTHEKSDEKWIEENRDRIFGTLLKLARSNYKTWFDKEQIALINEEAERLGPPDDDKADLYEGLASGNYERTSIKHAWHTVMGRCDELVPVHGKRIARLLDTHPKWVRSPKRGRAYAPDTPAGTRENPTTIWVPKDSVPSA